MPASQGSQMPNRPYSQRIVGPVWPRSSPDSWLETASGLEQKALDLNAAAGSIRRLTDGLGSRNSGQMIEAMCERSYRTAQTIINQSDLYGELGKAVRETAELAAHAQETLDKIDREAHEELNRLSQQAGGASMAALFAAREAVINAASTAANAVSTATVAAINEQAANIGGSPSDGAASNGQIRPADYSTENEDSDAAALDNPTGPGGTPPRQPSGDMPRWNEESSPRDDMPAGDDSASPGDQPIPESSEEGTPGAADNAANESAAPLSAGTPAADMGKWDTANSTATAPPVTTPVSGGAPTQGLSGIGSSFKPPSTGGLSPSGSGGGLSSGSPLSGGGVPASVSPASGGVPSTGGAPPSDFARGFNAGLGTGSVLPPPAASPPPAPMSSTTGAVASPVSPAPISAAGGMPNVGAGPVALGGPVPNMGPVGAPMMPPPPPAGGPLPSFNSDIPPRHVAPAGAGVTAAPPPAAAPAGAGGPTLPPGVVASNVGAAAGGAAAGAYAYGPDPLLDRASALVYELMHASRVYGCIDWCVGVFKTPSGPQLWVVSSEGSGYIPSGVFLPNSAHLVFSDPGLDSAFHARWFGWVNPAQTMLAYAQQCMANNPNVELWALAVSTDYGGAAAPVVEAGLRRVENCSLATSPIKAEAEAAALDESRIHRLETIDRVEYGRLTSGVTVDRSQLWALSVAAVRTALVRASELLGFEVPPVVRQVATAMETGSPVSDELWSELELAMRSAILDSSAARPGRLLSDAGPSAYARCFHNVARAAELLWGWRGDLPDYVEIAYNARHIAKEAELWPTMAA
jgi:hypothetical protein